MSSLVAFADVGDVVSVTPSDRLTLTVTGPFAGALGPDDDNLVLRALRALGAAAGIGEPCVSVTLDKQLPIAAGLGGGSSDAGAALRLTNRLLLLGLDDGLLEDISRAIGADGPMCLRARSAWAEGIGDRLTDEPRLPALHALLINPAVPSPTGAVYRAYDAAGPVAADMPAPPVIWRPRETFAWLGAQRNDLEAPAVALAPAIGRCLEVARTLPGARLARMSGSGATVFALFDTVPDAQAAEETVSRIRPDWWVRSTTLAQDNGQA